MMWKLAYPLIVSVIAVKHISRYLDKKYIEHRCSKELRFIFSDDYDCHFVTHHNRICITHITGRRPCSANCSFTYIQSIIKLIDEAQHTISLCMYHLTLENIGAAIIRARRRGVKVRCVTDMIMMECSGSKMPSLKNEGIVLKTQSSRQSITHHKFMLIDAEYETRKLEFGSMNFTLQGFLSNWELFIITRNERVIEDYNNGFNFLWDNLSNVHKKNE